MSEQLDITADDIAKAEHYPTLGPAYWACERIAESLMRGMESEPLKKIAAKWVDGIRETLYEYVEDHLRSDLETNLSHHMRNTVERTVQALLTGEQWALDQYPLAKYHDGEAIRKAVAKHGGDALLLKRIEDLEKEVERLESSLSFYRR